MSEEQERAGLDLSEMGMEAYPADALGDAGADAPQPAPGGMGEPTAIPLALLTLVVLQLVALPFQHAVTRHMEAEADWQALQHTRDPKSAEQLFATFVPTTLSDPNPPTWEYLRAADHP